MAIFKIAGLPVFKAVIEDEQDGMKRMSLVSSPAVEYGFLKFSTERQPVRLSVHDEERRLIYGVLARADMPIYRSDAMGEYFIVFSRDAIRMMAERYIAEGRANMFNLQHEDGSEVEGVRMVQWFIKDTARGIAPAEFPDVEDGSLFGEFHVLNDEVWEGIKRGDFRGFSLEGFFGMEPAEGILSTEKVAEDVKDYINNLNKDKMSKMDKIKAALAKLVTKVQLGSISTDKGVLFWDGDGELEVGMNVYQEEGAERVPAADGEYAIEGYILVVAGGKVEDIREIEEPEADPNGGAPAADDGGDDDGNGGGIAKKDRIRQEEIIVDETESTEEVVEEIVEEVNDKEERIEALERKVEDIAAELTERLAALEAKFAELAKTPQGKPAHQAVKEMSIKTDNSSFNKALKYAGKR